MSGVTRHPRLPRPVPPKRSRRDVGDDVLMWLVAFMVTGIVLAYLGVFDDLLRR